MKSSQFRRLRLKFLAISVSLLILFLATVSIAVYTAMSHSLATRNRAVLDYTAELISADRYIKENAPPANSPAPPAADVTTDEFGQAGADRLNQIWSMSHGETHLDPIMLQHVIVIFLTEDGKIQTALQNGALNSGYDDAIGKPLEKLFGTAVEAEGTVRIDDTSFRYKCYDIDDQSMCLMVNCEGDQVSLRQLMIILGSIGSVAILLLVCLCYHLSGKAIKPLEENWKQQQQFLHDASHELKTPLAVIATNVDAIRSCPAETVAAQDKWLSYIADEAADMRNLVNDMLTLAKGDMPRQGERIMQTFSISDVVEEAGLLMEANALDAGILLEADIEEDIPFIGNPEDIKHLMLIFLDNALKNTFEGGQIDIGLHRVSGELLITCKNTGRGIPASELKNIFRRFYRVDPSRARLTGGSGLGLSIAERIVAEYKGKIWAESEEGQWALFCVKLPAIKE